VAAERLAALTIVSGGQTGVDRAALDVAIELGLQHGGWVPKGRAAEDGPIPARYRVTETESRAYDERTKLNVRDSDGTLIVARGPLTGGTALTLDHVRVLGKPVLVIDIAETSIDNAAQMIREWIDGYKVERLNFAGPRASQDPTIYAQAHAVLSKALGEDCQLLTREGR
jgi:predicted Rossmann-fold nucleotide-binding protein